ncbi:hypothetical protein CUMW_202700 [Citrus unshiu]|uniref:Uncharacterized protein n=1 Tax=Citrus unshiu TaxID=55188 RepID=A0A2H5Q7B5_CITUN|nr:hypothetical protein CUMW_202700 [Citrus unshiu]
MGTRQASHLQTTHIILANKLHTTLLPLNRSSSNLDPLQIFQLPLCLQNPSAPTHFPLTSSISPMHHHQPTAQILTCHLKPCPFKGLVTPPMAPSTAQYLFKTKEWAWRDRARTKESLLGFLDMSPRLSIRSRAHLDVLSFNCRFRPSC